MTVCCSQHHCQECISPLQEASKPCPGCGQDEFSTVPHVRHRKTIMSLQVRCTMRERGCNWTGKLEELATHVDPENYNCQYVDVECPKQCGYPVPRCAVEYHVEKSCPKREYNCEYCEFSSTYEAVSDVHYQECALYPIPCPNSCRIDTIEQGKLHEHLKTCPYHQIECRVIGCDGKFLREDSEMHMEMNALKHVGMMSTAVMEMRADFESKLQGLESEAKEREREMDEKLEEKEREIATLESQLQQTKTEMQSQIDKLENAIATLSENFKEHTTNVFHQQSRLQAGDCPHHFIIQNFEQRKQNDITWHSRPMYVGSGPKIGISVRANGTIGTSARCTHVSVLLRSLVGERDDVINWPVRCSVTVEIQNQHRNKDHRRIQRGFQWERPTGRQTLGHFGKLPNHFHFISHDDLEWNAHKQTQFLKNNTLHLVVVRIEPHSQLYRCGTDQQTTHTTH